jgi:hypothetical protein
MAVVSWSVNPSLHADTADKSACVSVEDEAAAWTLGVYVDPTAEAEDEQAEVVLEVDERRRMRPPLASAAAEAEMRADAAEAPPCWDGLDEGGGW